MDDQPTEPIPIFRARAEQCAACGRLVAWRGEDGFCEVEGPGASLDDWPRGARWCDRGTLWRRAVPRIFLDGHDPAPSVGIRLGPLVALGLLGAAAILGAVLAALFAVG